MDNIASFWAYTLSCRCLDCGAGREVVLGDWIPHLPGDITLERFVSALPCEACGIAGRYELQAGYTPPIEGGRVEPPRDGSDAGLGAAGEGQRR